MIFHRAKELINKSTKGALAEARAEKFLRARGLICCAKNYRCPQGEIDLIMRDSETLVFVEVRLRSNPNFEQAAESVSARKQHKIIRAAQHYLLHHQLTDKIPCRFDVIAFDGADEINWIADAFSAA